MSWKLNLGLAALLGLGSFGLFAGHSYHKNRMHFYTSLEDVKRCDKLDTKVRQHPYDWWLEEYNAYCKMEDMQEFIKKYRHHNNTKDIFLYLGIISAVCTAAGGFSLIGGKRRKEEEDSTCY